MSIVLDPESKLGNWSVYKIDRRQIIVIKSMCRITCILISLISIHPILSWFTYYGNNVFLFDYLLVLMSNCIIFTLFCIYLNFFDVNSTQFNCWAAMWFLINTFSNPNLNSNPTPSQDLTRQLHLAKKRIESLESDGGGGGAPGGNKENFSSESRTSSTGSLDTLGNSALNGGTVNISSGSSGGGSVGRQDDSPQSGQVRRMAKEAKP